MDTVITIMQIALILLFTGGGITKLTLPYARFTKMPFQEWSHDFKPEHIRLIGVLEAAAAVGMIAALLSGAPFTPLVAVGMALVMAGAIATHLRRSEYLNIIGNSVWLSLALFVAYNTLISL